MKAIKKYIKPKIIIVEPMLTHSSIICSSNAIISREYENTQKDSYYECSTFCKLWHICRDRDHGKYCRDIQYS